MKLKALSFAFVAALSFWMGASFVSSNELPLDAQERAAVTAEHPDSHRLGALVNSEEVAPLPEWEKTSPVLVGELALLGN